ncbi:tetratricopeptide repeat protein [Parabacteroides sp. OttesenSCG-928-G21]|nr:tetratricopeptide repeat protein [Parabacteroides sp. OttesenSCG-928-G21]
MGVLSANHVYYINSGAYYFEEKAYQKAYDAFEQYLEIAHHPMFQGAKVAEKSENYNTVLFYSAIAATQLNDSQKAIAALERAKTTELRTSEIYQYLAYEYEQVGDTVKWEQTLEEGMAKFPDEKYFLMVLINNYIYSNRNEQAIDFLNKAITSEPTNPQLYDVLGRVYETGLNDVENAEKYFQKALEVDPNYTEALIDLGRVYYNKGVHVQEEANMLSDNTKYQEEVAKAKEYYNKALPYFVKARETKPDEREVLVALRGIYYNLSMGAEFEEIEKAMGISE